MSQNVLFLICLAIFLVIIIYVGIRSKSQVTDADDYILAGRGVGFWMNVVNVMSIGFAGTAITLCGYFTMHFGLFGGMFANGINALMYVVYGLLFGTVIRDSGAQTLPEWVEVRYDRKTRNVIAICGIVGMIGILANNIMSIVTIVGAYTGWPTWIILVVSFAVILSFAFIAGMWGVSTSAFAQMIIGVIIVPTFFFILAGRYGFADLSSNWPSGPDWIFHGVTGLSYGWTDVVYPGFLAAMPTSIGLVIGSSYYWTRLATCRNAKTGRNSFIVGGLIMFVVFYIPLCFAGLYAGAYHSEAFTYFGGSVAPTGAYGYIAAMFPAIIGALTVIAAIAAAISTAATALIGSTATVSRDVYSRMINKNATQEQKQKATKIITVVVCVVCLIMCAYPGGAQTIFGVACAFLVPAAILLLLGVFAPKFNTSGALVGSFLGLVFMLIFYILELVGIYSLSKTVHIALVGLGVTVVGCIVGSFFGKPKYFGQKGWELKATATNREDIKLDAQMKDILTLVRRGHSTYSDVVDYLGKDMADVNASVEALDRGGYIERESLRGGGFFHFHVTEKGWNAITVSAEEDALNKKNLSVEYVPVLNAVKEGGAKALGQYAKENKLGSLRLSSIISHLVRCGYMTDNKGLNSAKYEMTAKGDEVLKSL